MKCSFSWFLWEALGLPADVRQAALCDVDHIVQQLRTTQDLTPVHVTREEVESLLLPLALAFQNLARARQQRVLVGITGGPGTGKTVLSHQVGRVLNVLAGREIAICLGVDAYHYPNALLDTRSATEQGRAVPLRKFKGLPHTYDVRSLVADLRRLRSDEEHEVQLPVYDRQRHDPLPGALKVFPHHRVVVVEGLHLLRPEQDWDDARACLDFCTLLDLPLETCHHRVATRKIAGGRLPADVDAHFERVDRPTLEQLQDPAVRARANLVIRLEEAERAGSAAETRLCGCERREKIVQPAELRAIAQGAVRLLAVGLNPALQKTLVFDRWERGQVNRARTILWSVGGKGQQFSRAASHLCPDMVTLVQFLGGENGDRLGRMIAQAGVNQITAATAGETRCCTTVVDAAAGDATELIEPSAPILPGEAAPLLAKALETLARGDVAGLALCGTYPPGVDESFYVTLAQSKGQAILLLDSYQQIPAVLATGRVDILKVNVHELRSLAESTRRGDQPACAEPIESIPAMALTLFATHQLRALAVTAGPDTAWLFEAPSASSSPCPHRTWRFYEYRLPVVDGVVNPIGAGDTVGAVFLAQLCAGAPAPQAFACGLAAGSASCRQLGGADFALADLHEILPRIQVSCTTRWSNDNH